MMNFYEIALLNSPLKPLTYQSEQNIQIGTKVEVKLARRKTLSFGVVVKDVPKPTFKCKDIDKINDELYDNKMIQTAQFISSYYICSLGEALSLYIAFTNHQNIKELSAYTNHYELELSAKQEELFEFTQTNNQALLFASTGSGKTEIYIKAIQEKLQQNFQAIMLMPEISLTPQMQIRLEKAFGGFVAIWHSKVTKKRKKEILEGLSDGTIRVIAGARSSLFLPYTSLGLIIVDEEHDESYKADKKPRINVKDLSLYIGKKFDIQVILGSATPSITSYKKIPYIRNKETYFKTQKIINFDESNLGVTQPILDSIQNTMNQNKQAIIFVPTRANFKYQICSDCGESVQCPFCSVSLSMHKNSKVLKCHYCNYTQTIVDTCPSCQTGVIRNFRLGTAEIKLILEEYFTTNTIEVFDRDTIKTDKQLKDVLKRFNNQAIDILIGTQMLSKGHDYHNVTLAVVLGIDSLLKMTSYKSREKALSLALQIAGRSGRKGIGEVLIQTKNKDFFSQYLEQNNYEEFLEEELSYRTDLYPPYVRIAKVVFSHQNAFLAKEQLDKYAHIFSSLTNQVQLIGFGESPIFKIAKKYRYELLLRSVNTKALLNTLHSIDSPIASIDMDTIS